MPEIVLFQPKAGKWEIANIRLPISLLSVAALPDQEGYKIKFIDQRTDKDWKKTLENSFKSKPLCLGITSMTGNQIKYALEAAKIAKENEVPVVLGGIHPSLLPEQTIANESIDILVTGEGDITFLELVHALEKEKALRGIKGVWYKENGTAVKNKPRLFADMNELPDLPYHLIDVNDYSSFNIGRGRAISIMTSRGCPFRCAFCYNVAFHKRCWRALSVENVLARVQRVIDDFGIRDIYFEDDNFCGNVKRFQEIIAGFIREKFDLFWGTVGIRMDSLQRINREFLSTMEKSGCKNIDIGIESGSPRILKLMQKDETIEQMIRTNKKLSEFPFILKCSFVIGAPTETEHDLHLSSKLALRLTKDNKYVYTPFFIFTPYPCTKLFDLALKHGFKPPNSLEGWMYFDQENWFLKYPSWYSKKRIKILSTLHFTSYFANKNARYKITKKYMRIIFEIYHPFARFRFINSFHHFPIEMLLEKYFNR